MDKNIPFDRDRTTNSFTRESDRAPKPHKPKRVKKLSNKKPAPTKTAPPPQETNSGGGILQSIGLGMGVLGLFWLWRRKVKIKNRLSHETNVTHSTSYRIRPTQYEKKQLSENRPTSAPTLIRSDSHQTQDEKPNWEEAGKDGEKQFVTLARAHRIIVERIEQGTGDSYEQYQEEKEEDYPTKRKRPDFIIQDTHPPFDVEVKTYTPCDEDGKLRFNGNHYFFTYREIAGLCRFQNDRRNSRPDYAILIAIFSRKDDKADKDSLKMFRVDEFFQFKDRKVSLTKDSLAKYCEVVHKGKSKSTKGCLVPISAMNLTFEDLKRKP